MISTNPRFPWLTLLVLGLLAVPPGRAQSPDPAADAAPSAAIPDRTAAKPEELAGLELVENLDGQIPLDLQFTDHTGKPVRLGDYFDGERPLILTLNYYRCPMLCGLTLNAMVRGLQDVTWTAGDEYRILTVSFDPLEGSELANLKRRNYLEEYGRPAVAQGWDFLTGRPEPIHKLLDVTGFPVRWSDKTNQWIHPAVLIVCTPDGHISRYLKGVHFEPKTLRLSLVEASEGKIGSTVDQVLLFCFDFDPEAGQYTLAAFNLMRAGAILTMIVLAGVLTFLWQHKGQHRTPVPQPETGSDEVGESVDR
jgi:protein SCO1/2